MTGALVNWYKVYTCGHICDTQIGWINLDHDWRICALVSIVYTWVTSDTQAD